VSTIDSGIKWDKVKTLVKINLYRIIQESLQNCNKYANATVIKVELKEDDSIVLLIKTTVPDSMLKQKKGIGLQNMISRTNEATDNLMFHLLWDKEVQLWLQSNRTKQIPI
jgi:signal transduction histidine kinase